MDAATVKEDDGAEETEELTETGVKRYRSLAAVVNFLSFVRPNLQYTACVVSCKQYTSKTVKFYLKWLRRKQQLLQE